MNKNRVMIYPVPDYVALREDFTVSVRAEGEKEWKNVQCYEVKVDMHEVRKASMACFDFEGRIDIRIRFNNYMDIYRVDVRPKRKEIVPTFTEHEIFFSLEHPENLSIEINNDRFHNLHLFAGRPCRSPGEENILRLTGDLHRPKIHSTDEIRRRLELMPKGRCLVFEPGLHYLEECIFKIPSDTQIYIDGGAVIVGGLVCENVKNVKIYGHGIIHQAAFERFSALRGLRISHSSDICLEGLTFINPPHYTVYIGGSEKIRINGIKSFSCEGWSDGIDMMSSREIRIQNIFMRNSDDCIAIYGKRWDFQGDTRDIRVRNAVLWADVAHPVNIGCHGDIDRENIIEDIVFQDIDILEHHEPQQDCMGCMCVNAGDRNTVRNIRFEDIYVEHMEHGRLFDLRIICGRYNSAPGRLIENIFFKNIRFCCDGEEISRISGDRNNPVRNIIFKNHNVRVRRILRSKQGNIQIGENVHNVTFS